MGPDLTPEAPAAGGEGAPDRARAALGRGDCEGAIGILAPYVRDHPLDSLAWRILATAHQSLGRVRAALVLHRRTLALDPSEATDHFNLANALVVEQRYAEATAAYAAALALWPAFLGARLNQARLLAAQGLREATVRAHRRILALEPGSPLSWHNFAMWCVALHEIGDAETAARRSTDVGPGYVYGWMALSAIVNMDPARGEEARVAARRAARHMAPEARPASGSERCRVLVVDGVGNRPYNFRENGQMHVGRDTNCPDCADPATQTTIRVMTEAIDADPSLLAAVGRVDVVFPALGDADLRGPCLDTAERVIAGLGVPAINRPESVRATRRDRNAARFGGRADLVFPATLRLDLARTTAAEAAERIAEEVGFPVIVRRAATHWGGTMVLHPDRGAARGGLERLGSATAYAIRFVETPKHRGLSRRLRFHVIDGVPYPVNVHYADDWNVHGDARERLMGPSEELQRAERAFLEDPESAIGSSAMRALSALAREIDLDWYGIDFDVLEDGRPVVFEANAAMALQHRQAEAFPYLRPALQRIVVATRAMIQDRADRGPARPV